MREAIRLEQSNEIRKPGSVYTVIRQEREKDNIVRNEFLILSGIFALFVIVFANRKKLEEKLEERRMI